MLTECLAETDHKDEAAALFEEYINNHDDKDITALSYLGDIYSEMEDYEKALQYLYKAESLGRNDVWININTGYALIKTNNLEKATEYDDKAELYTLTGLCNEKLGKYDEAFDYYKKAQSFKDLPEIRKHISTLKKKEYFLLFFKILLAAVIIKVLIDFIF